MRTKLLSKATRNFLPVLFLGMLAYLSPKGSLAADNYPSHTITFVVPFGAGGGTDYMARTLAQALEPVLGQSVVVENRAGAAGAIGSAYVARAKADGYTILVGSTGTHSANEFLYKSLPYSPEKDFKPVTLINTFDNVIVVPASSPFKTLKDLVNDAKAHPGKLTYGITTIGSSSHLAIAKFLHDSKLDMLGIPYNSSPEATNDVLGGRLAFMLDLVSTQLGNIQAGKLRPLAVTSLDRSPILPDVPTIAESGYPGFDAIGWVGLFAPAGTPDVVGQKLYSAISQVFKDESFRDKFIPKGLGKV